MNHFLRPLSIALRYCAGGCSQRGHRGRKIYASSQPIPLNELTSLQINEVCEFYRSGEAAALVLSRVGLRVVFERDVVQLSGLCFPDYLIIAANRWMKCLVIRSLLSFNLTHYAGASLLNAVGKERSFGNAKFTQLVQY